MKCPKCNATSGIEYKDKRLNGWVDDEDYISHTIEVHEIKHK